MSICSKRANAPFSIIFSDSLHNISKASKGVIMEYRVLTRIDVVRGNAYSICTCSMVSITIIPPKGPRSAAFEASEL